MQEATKSAAPRPDSKPVASNLAQELQALDRAANLTGLNIKSVQLVRDLVNAKAVAILTLDSETEQLGLEAGDESVATALATVSSGLSQQIEATQQVFRINPIEDSSDNPTFVIAQLSDKQTKENIRLIAIETHPSTGFALALTCERLELLRSVYQNTGVARMIAGRGALTSELLEALEQEKTTDGKLQAIADFLCQTHNLPELVVAQISNGKPERITFNKTGRPHAASRTLSEAKAAISSGLGQWKSNGGNDNITAHANEAWAVTILASNGRPSIALAFRPRSMDSDQTQSMLVSAASHELRTIASAYKPVLIAAGANKGLAGAWASLKSAAFRWRSAAALLIPLALLALIPYPDRIEAPFRLVASETRVVTAPFDAVLESVYVKTDEPVSKGATVLARLSTREIDLGISRNVAKKAAAEAKRAIARIAQDPAKVKQAQLEADIADAEIALLTYRKSLAELKPQLTGVVTAAEIENRIGTVVTRGQTLFEIADTSALDIEVFVADNRILDLVTGQDGEISLAAQPGQSLPIKVESIHPLAEIQSDRTVFRVDARFAEASKADLRPGMEGVAKITTGTSTLGWLAIRDAVNFIRSYFWI